MDNFKRSVYAMRAKSNFEKSLLKATYEGDYDPPKEKHVQTLLWALQGHDMETPVDHGFSLMTQRLMTGRWATALKTLVILHRGIEQIGQNFASKLSSLKIPLEDFNDPSERGSAHNPVIREYWGFIHAKAECFGKRGSIMNVESSERSRAIEKMANSDLVKEVSLMMNQLHSLVKLGPACHQALRNYHLKVTQNLTFLVLKDSTPLYRVTALMLDRIVDKFYKLPKQQATIILEQYKKFETCTRMLSQFFEVARHLPYSGLNPPTFVNRPKEVVHSMKRYIEEGEAPEGGEGGEEVYQELGLSPQELEEQRKILEQYEKEQKKKPPPRQEPQRESQREPQKQETQDFLFEPQKPDITAQNPKIDYIMSAYNQSQVPQSQPQQPQMGNPMMMNPMMTGMNPMMNPYMTGMNPMMGMNPFMTYSMNPMMPSSQPMSQPQNNTQQPSQNSSNPFGNQSSSSNPFGNGLI